MPLAEILSCGTGLTGLVDVMQRVLEDLLETSGDSTMSPSMTARMVWMTSGPKIDLTR